MLIMDGSDENMIIYQEEEESDSPDPCYICNDVSSNSCTWCMDKVCDSCIVETDYGIFCPDCNSVCTNPECDNVEYVKQHGSMVESSIFFACDECSEPFCYDCINEIEISVFPNELDDNVEKIKLYLCHECTEYKQKTISRAREFIYRTRIHDI